MIFSKLYDKPLETLNFRDELVPFFVDYVFDKFMDQGRRGVEQAAVDIIDNFYTFLKANGNAKQKKFNLSSVPNDEFKKLERAVQRQLMDTFIREGSTGLVGALFTSYSIVAGVMDGNKLN